MRIGYLGVVVPAQDFWQGFYITDAVAAEAESALAKLRANPPPTMGSEVIQPFQPYGKRLSDIDQTLLGGFCAAITSAALVLGKGMGIQTINESTAVPNPETVIATYGYAIRLLINRDYFWIEGKKVAGGTRTTINPLYVSSVNEARDAINSLSLVTKIKRRLVANSQAQDKITDEAHYRGKLH